MTSIRLIKHAPGAPGLRIFGLGPQMQPAKGILKLKELLDKHAFWAKDRSPKELRHLLAQSTVVISLWSDKRMIGFGRATSDGLYRAVLWDIVVARDLQGLGLGRKVVDALLSAHALKKVEKIYLMTTYSTEFYLEVGFKKIQGQQVLVTNGNEYRTS